MSDIQEEQKRLYKRAEENDLIQIANKITENTLLMKQAGDKAINKINELQNRINKAIEYIKDDMHGEPNELYGLVDGEKVLNILKGDNNE